jgi:phosphoglycolate phosphatase
MQPGHQCAKQLHARRESPAELPSGDTISLMLILFDLDGTLTDPFDGVSRSFAHALELMGLPPFSEQAMRGVIGPPLQDSFAALGLTQTDTTRAVGLFRERYAEVGLFENRVYDGIPALLQALAGANVTMAVATSKPTEFAERILEHFDLRRHFAFVSGSTMDGGRRHKADIVRHALNSLDAGPAQAVLVGDRAQDAIGAAKSGVGFIGARWGYAELGELEAAGTTRFASIPSELLHCLTQT